jgi:hypothetical protein
VKSKILATRPPNTGLINYTTPTFTGQQKGIIACPPLSDKAVLRKKTLKFLQSVNSLVGVYKKGMMAEKQGKLRRE